MLPKFFEVCILRHEIPNGTPMTFGERRADLINHFSGTVPETPRVADIPSDLP